MRLSSYFVSHQNYFLNNVIDQSALEDIYEIMTLPNVIPKIDTY